MHKPIRPICQLAFVLYSGILLANTQETVTVQGEIKPQAARAELNTTTVVANSVFLNDLAGSGQLDSIEQVQANALQITVHCEQSTQYDLRLAGDTTAVAPTLFNQTDFSSFGSLSTLLQSGAFAFPLSNSTNSENDAAYIHIVAEPINKVVNLRSAPGEEPVAYRLADEQLGLFNSQGVNAIYNQHSIVVACTTGDVDTYDITAIWHLDTAKVDNTQANTLQGSITMQLTY